MENVVKTSIKRNSYETSILVITRVIGASLIDVLDAYIKCLVTEQPINHFSNSIIAWWKLLTRISAKNSVKCLQKYYWYLVSNYQNWNSKLIQQLITPTVLAITVFGGHAFGCGISEDQLEESFLEIMFFGSDKAIVPANDAEMEKHCE